MSQLLVATRALLRSRDRATSILTILALALPHAVFLSVIGGVYAFMGREANPMNAVMEDQPYTALAVFAAVLVVIPALSMGAAAARLGVSRKAQALAVQRLVGLPPAPAQGAAMLDTLAHAAVGIAVGSVLYAAILPVWQLISFHGVPLSIGEMWMGVLPLLACGTIMLGLTALSSITAMRKVMITPLGVVRRTDRAKVSWVNIVVALVLLALWFGPGQLITRMDLGETLVLTILMGFFAGAIAVVNLVGPWTLQILGRIIARVARRPETLLAGRRIVEDPKAVWRSFGAMSLVGFIVGLMIPAMELVRAVSPEVTTMPAEMAAQLETVFIDIRTGLFLTLGMTVVLAAIATAIQQSIRVVDTAAQAESLERMGATASFLHRSRRREVAIPAVVTIGGALLAGVLFMAPVMAVSNPVVPLAVLAVTLVVSVVLIVAAAESGRFFERKTA
ncbi:ABC transporter permease [Schaalia sp. Marseille-Q2122]|uniref:ABC transporter permease n=1 Tax=Schaalia sp. Marseille-Q2122 TaxID=2736604 RepID=UPI0015883E46|nr:ABC transporter permease [Schaalia sp. Marseille-Q2122]